MEGVILVFGSASLFVLSYGYGVGLMFWASDLERVVMPRADPKKGFQIHTTGCQNCGPFFGPCLRCPKEEGPELCRLARVCVPAAGFEKYASRPQVIVESLRCHSVGDSLHPTAYTPNPTPKTP